MRAIRFHRTGGPEVLVLDDVPAPRPGPGEVRIAVAFAGVNFIDTYLRTGYYPPGPLPAVAGREVAGVVDAVGEGVTEARVGDRIAAMDSRGGYAEAVLARADRLLLVPERLGLDRAAALALQGLTAHYLLRSIHPLSPGDAVLIHAAAGGVGRLLVQIAKRAGAEVFATCSTAAKAAVARSAGADHVILYTETSFADQVLRATGGRGVDLALDGVGRSTLVDSVRATRVRGEIVFYGQSSGEPDPIRPRALLGSRTLTTATLGDYARTRQELLERAREVFSWAEDGWLEVAIDRVLPLGAAAEAQRLLVARATAGKLLLDCGV